MRNATKSLDAPGSEMMPKRGSSSGRTKINLFRSSAFVLAAVLMSSGLTSCDKKNANTPASGDALALPLTTGPATVIVPAPAAAALPSAPPVRIVRVANQSDEYAYADRAYAMSSAVGQAPPDYEFDYQGVHTWAWRSSDRSVRLTEPVDGGYRYYYYQPGASEPYLVRDPQYSYGYSDGQLVTVYDSEGRLLPPEYIDQRADNASRYLARAVALYEASVQNQRHSVNAANWAERRAELDAARSQWQAQQSQQDAWRAYHAEHAVEEQAHWQAEHERRDQSARSFDDWSSRGYNGPPPPPAYYAGGDARGYQRDSGQGGTYTTLPQNSGGSSVSPLSGLLGSIMGHRGDSRDVGQPVQSPPNYDPQRSARESQQQQTSLDQARAQQAQADTARQAQEKAQQQSLAQARQQQSQADAAHQAQAQAQVRAQEDAIARARQQQVQADATRQAQIQAQQQAVAQARQQQAQAYAVRQSQAKTAADAAAQAQQQRVQADAARAQQQAQADAAHKAQAQADAVRKSQAKAAADAAAQVAPTVAPQPKAQDDAHRDAAKRERDDKHHRDDAPGRTQAQ